MKKQISVRGSFWFCAIVFALCAITLHAQTGIVPVIGKTPQGAAPQLSTAASSNGIDYHGGPIILNSHNVYFIWYGSWSGNSALSILPSFITGLNGSTYFNIDTTYPNGESQSIVNNLSILTEVFDSYSQGTSLNDQGLQNVVSRQLTEKSLPTDPNGIYFVLTSADVVEQGAAGTFCIDFCGFHTHAMLNGADIKYAFVGNIDRCPQACAAGNIGQGPNGNVGADAMANVISHELSETITDPDLNAWFDSSGNEVGDKCNFLFGPEFTTSNGAPANLTLGGLNFLIQQLWVNAAGGFCGMSFTNNIPAASTPISGNASPTGSHRLWVFLLREDQHLQELFYNSSLPGWQEFDLTATTGAPLVALNGGLTSFVDSSEQQYVFYLTTNQHVHELFYNGHWTDFDLTAETGNHLTQSGSKLTSFLDSHGQHLVYEAPNQHIHQLFYNGSWTDQDLSGVGNALVGTALTSFACCSGNEHIYYQGTNGHVLQLFFNGSWINQDLTILGNGSIPANGTGLTSFQTNGDNHLFYLTSTPQVHQLFFNGTWVDQNLGGSPAAGSALSSFDDDSCFGEHVPHISGNQHIHQLFFNGSSWVNQDLTALAPGSHLALLNTALASFADPCSEFIFYQDTNQHINMLKWDPSVSAWNSQVIF